jgi:hypothetical protein
MTAYPQATRSAREAKSEKGNTKKEAAQRSVQRSESRSGSERKTAAAAAQRSRQADRSASFERPKSNNARTESARPRVETRSGNRDVNTGNAERRERITISRPDNNSNNQERRQSTITRPENRAEPARNIRESGNSGEREFRVNNSSASRVYREGRGTLTREDGTVVRHQNDEVFASRKYKLDYDNYENLRRSDEFRRDYRDYDDWSHRRVIRNHFRNNYMPLSFELRRSRYYYRAPHHLDLIWTPLLFHRFMYYYPTQNDWNMEFGSSIETISADEAQNYAGTVRRVYGKVAEVFYSPEDENYILYIGDPFPYQDVSIVVPKHVARNLSLSPKWYFENEFVWVVGLINVWEGKPEIIVRDEEQIRRY